MKALDSAPGRRVLLLTSHPLDARDGADKELSLTIASGMPDVDFTWFGQVGKRRTEPLRTGRRLPLLSLTGMPGVFERTQAAGLTLLMDRRVDLLHAVVTVGPHFADFARLRERILGPMRRPAIHTVPAVADVGGLRGSRPLGTTVALSRATQQALLDAGFPDVRLIPPGIDLSRWPVRPRVDGGAPVVAFAGHYDVEGGLWDTVQALGTLARGRRIQGLFLMRPRPGQDEKREAAALLARAREAGLGDVRVHGRTPDMPGMLAGVDVLLLPARELGGKADVPLTVLEAMASGRPVVVTELPQMSDLGDAVTCVPVGDLPALAGAVRRLVDEPAQWEAMARAGRARVEEHFSSDVMVRRYAELYDEVLDLGTGSTAPGTGPSSARSADTG